MQQHIKNLDGSSKGVQDIGPAYVTPQELIDHAIEISIDQATGGFHVIFGDDLDHEPSEQEVNVIAERGILFFQNLTDTPA